MAHTRTGESRWMWKSLCIYIVNLPVNTHTRFLLFNQFIYRSRSLTPFVAWSDVNAFNCSQIRNKVNNTMISISTVLWPQQRKSDNNESCSWMFCPLLIFDQINVEKLMLWVFRINFFFSNVHWTFTLMKRKVAFTGYNSMEWAYLELGHSFSITFWKKKSKSIGKESEKKTFSKLWQKNAKINGNSIVQFQLYNHYLRLLLWLRLNLLCNHSMEFHSYCSYFAHLFVESSWNEKESHFNLMLLTLFKILLSQCVAWQSEMSR